MVLKCLSSNRSRSSFLALIAAWSLPGKPAFDVEISKGFSLSDVLTANILVLVNFLFSPIRRRNNIIKHSMCLSLDAKLPIQECLKEKLRFASKLLESGNGNIGLNKNQRDMIAALNLKLNGLSHKETEKLRAKFPYFSRFEKALSKSNITDLPLEKDLMFQQE